MKKRLIEVMNEKEHYNLYYLFLEDKQANPMPESKKNEIKKILIEMFEGKKMNAQQFRDNLYEDLCESKRIYWASLNFDSENEQNILIELKDGSKFEIFIMKTDREI